MSHFENEIEKHVFIFSRFNCIDWFNGYRLRMSEVWSEDTIEIKADCPRSLWIAVHSAVRFDLRQRISEK